MNDIEKRIAALERENRDLKGRLDALQPAKAMPLPPSPVRIMSPPLARLVLPTEEEFQRLLAVVIDRYPILKPRADSPDYFTQFKAAFIRLLHCGRRDKVDNQRGLPFWLDDCREFCDRHRIHPSWITGAAFTAAVIAHGDIRFVMDDWPHDTAFGLQFGGGGHPASDWWRRVLAGTLLSQTPPLYPKAPPSPARARQVVWR